MKKIFLAIFPAIVLTACGGSSDADHSENNMTDTSAVDSTAGTLTFEAFVAKCANLSYNETSSLDSITAWFQASKDGFNADQKDSSCLLYVEQMNKLSGEVYGEYDQQKEFEKNYGPYGFTIGAGEGELWLIPNTDKAAQKFEGDLSDDFREYMRLGEITGKQYSADAGMMISYEEWGDMLIDLEDRIRANRDSKYYKDYVAVYQSYLRWYMWGMDNTPITKWDGEPGLNDEVKKAYEKMMNDTKHRTGAIIQVHWFNMETGDGYNIPWDEQWVPSFDEVEHYFYDELELNEG
ncbi:MAG: hypothetical protein R2780_14420 [Crocinitomicaceae bacterium]|nr:hypothetical protein [Crocinitomicaceae bacterium]